MKLGAGARKYQGSTVSTLTSSWFKVYQNRGKNEVCEEGGGAAEQGDGTVPHNNRCCVAPS